jgi:hypothetical protein
MGNLPLGDTYVQREDGSPDPDRRLHQVQLSSMWSEGPSYELAGTVVGDGHCFGEELTSGPTEGARMWLISIDDRDHPVALLPGPALTAQLERRRLRPGDKLVVICDASGTWVRILVDYLADRPIEEWWRVCAQALDEGWAVLARPGSLRVGSDHPIEGATEGTDSAGGSP